ncbi:hypothetical protein MA16_Dca023447 [Dendrobium catenatum]|uniref:Uncharacterized protein n=1 Tax=Dendrobium catenatum TaxID=906689 RepID=A0A2I0WYL0_9ASPA|nr:hypothetical protein MA16_Dca023447 [Dendrobium catenatum]
MSKVEKVRWGIDRMRSRSGCQCMHKRRGRLKVWSRVRSREEEGSRGVDAIGSFFQQDSSWLTSFFVAKVPFGGKTTRFKGSRVITVYPAVPFGGKTTRFRGLRVITVYPAVPFDGKTAS